MPMPRSLFLAGPIAAVMLVGLAQAQAHECHCHGIVLNGSLNTADFNGGVGYGAEYGGMEVIGYSIRVPSASAFAFAHAQAFGFARSTSLHGGHAGAHGCHGGGGHR